MSETSSPESRWKGVLAGLLVLIQPLLGQLAVAVPWLWFRTLMATMAVLLITTILAMQLVADVIVIIGRFARMQWPPLFSVLRIGVIAGGILLCMDNYWPYGRKMFWPYVAMVVIFFVRFEVLKPARDAAPAGSWWERNEPARSGPGLMFDLLAKYTFVSTKDPASKIAARRRFSPEVYLRAAFVVLSLTAVALLDIPEVTQAIAKVEAAATGSGPEDIIAGWEPSPVPDRGSYRRLPGQREDVCRNEPTVEDELTTIGIDLQPNELGRVVNKMKEIDPNDLGCLVDAFPAADGFALRLRHPDNSTNEFDGLVTWTRGRASVVLPPFAPSIDRRLRSGAALEWVLERTDTTRGGYLQAVVIAGQCTVLLRVAEFPEPVVLEPALSSVLVEAAGTNNLIIVAVKDSPDGFVVRLAQRGGGNVDHAVTATEGLWEIRELGAARPPLWTGPVPPVCGEKQLMRYVENSR